MINQSPHITLLCSRLDLPGGIERTTVNTANLLADKGHRVTLLILDETHKSFYSIHPSIQIIQQPLFFGITSKGNILSRKWAMLKDVLRLKKIIKHIQPTHIISTEYPFTVACVLAGAKKKSALYAWEHHHFGWLAKNKFWRFLCNQTYPLLTGIICLNKEEAAHYKKFAPTYIIPNFIENVTGIKSTLNNKTLLSVGWLIHRKGIDLLLKIAKEVLNQHPEWTWKLIGDGEMKKAVIDFIKIEKLEGKLILQSPQNSNINNEYINSSIFVLTSRFEAFPMVLLEAMSFGVPCVSFDCQSGPADIISQNINGLLVEKENTTKMVKTISFLISDESLRKKMGENAYTDVQQFSPEKVYELWKVLF